MARGEERVELRSAPGRLELTVPQTPGDVERRVLIGVRLPATDPAAKRLLLWAIASGHIVTPLAFLRGIGALHLGRPDAPLSRAPRQLCGDLRQVGGVEVGVHPPRLE